jgi:hypothetical protein
VSDIKRWYPAPSKKAAGVYKNAGCFLSCFSFFIINTYMQKAKLKTGTYNWRQTPAVGYILGVHLP